jgi:uncharacterized protein (DUF4213/DUF364 family)
MATTLTADQAEQIAHGLLDCADSIDRRIVTDWKTLDDAIRQQLMALAQQMRAKAALLVNQAVGMILDNAKDAFAQIGSATKAGEAAIDNIQTVSRVIQVATALVALGAAVASKDPEASVTAAQALFDEIA